jgi:penicillin-binding protein 1A
VVVFLILIVTGVTVASAAAIAAGGAAGVTLATLEQGLPDVRAFRDLDFSQPTVLYDRKGPGRGTELARFWDERREVVKFEDIPPLVLDATTATEDDTFWTNPGVDLEATVNALLTEAAGGGDRGGGSTITQQFVRARLLPEEVIQAGLETKEGQYLRKAKEILQAYRLTQAFPGEEGKKKIITAYLNEISYGAAQGIAAAADIYLGKELTQLSLSEAALLAAIPQEPRNLYPWATLQGKYTNVVKEKVKGKRTKKGKARTRLLIKSCVDKGDDCQNTELIDRRNFILARLRDGKGRSTSITDDQYQEALRETIVIRKPQSQIWKAPHFVNAVLPELSLILADRDPIKVGGYKVTTTLDYRAQKLGEKFIMAGAVIPNMLASKAFQAIKKSKLGRDAGWINRLRGLNLRNGGLVAMDYRTGDILAYVGSAGYYRSGKNNPRFDPKFDHVGQGRRQPGSAWKPIVYATGIDTGALTAGTPLLDITTQFGPGWTPKNADGTDSGPILVRDAIQQSLNVPAIRALDRTGVKTVRKYALKAGFTFLEDFGNKALDVAGLAGAIGTVEVRPLDMTAAFGAFGNDGKVTKPRYILKVEGPDGEVIYQAGKPVTTQVWKPSTAYIMADILAGNTNPAENAVWANVFAMNNTRNGKRRPAAVKTGTTNNLKDYSTYGFLPMPKKSNQTALAVGVWYGNSNSAPQNLAINPVYSLDNAGQTWHSFVRDYMNNKPAPDFKRPKSGVVTARIDARYGGAAGAGPGRTELFVRGTQPGGNKQVDPTYSGCVDLTKLENPGAPASWISTVRSWAARRGACASGPATTSPSTDSADSSTGGGNGNGGGGGNRGGGNGGGNGNGGGGGPEPAPTCRPGTSNKPPGCVIP